MRALGVPVQRIAVHVLAVQERDVARIDAAFHRLQVVALLPALAVVAMRRRQQRPFELREWRLQLGRPHIGPQNAATLDQRVRFQFDLVAEAALRRLGRHVDALAGVVVLPAVIGAAQPVLLVTAEPQRDAAVRAEFVGQRQIAPGVAPSQQALRHDFHAHRRAFVFRQFLGMHDGHPIAPQQRAHRRSRPGLGYKFVLFGPEHGMLPITAVSALKTLSNGAHHRILGIVYTLGRPMGTGDCSRPGGLSRPARRGMVGRNEPIQF